MARWGVSRGLITLCCAEAKVVRKPLAQPDELQQNSGVGFFFVFKPVPKRRSFLEAAGEATTKAIVLHPCISSSLARRLVAVPSTQGARRHPFV